MTFQEAIAKCCSEYAKDPDVRFIGYNTFCGSKMYGTLQDVVEDCTIESPVSENLMVGLAMGMSLEGLKPVVCFERHDFILLALDAIVNHLDKMPWLSGDQFDFNVVIRAIVGSKTPLQAGVQHTQDYSTILRKMLTHVKVLEPKTPKEYINAWKTHAGQGKPVIFIEHKDWYDRKE